MRNIKKHFIIIFAVLFLLPPLAAAMAQDRVVRSAAEKAYPPFSDVNDQGEAEGFAVALMRAALAQAGLEVDYYVGLWPEIMADLSQGRIDALPLVGRTPEREALFDFTVPYLSLYGAVFVREGSREIEAVEDLAGREIAVMAGDNSEEFVRRERISGKISLTKTFEEAFIRLADGQYDAVITQEIVGKKLLEKLGIDSVYPAFQLEDFRQDFTFAVKKGDQDLLALLNEGLSRTISNGTYDEIYNSWLDGSVRLIPEEAYGNESYIEEKALEAGWLIENYLVNNPGTIDELRADEDFAKLAVQKVGQEGYTALLDANSGEIYFHPQADMVGRQIDWFKDELPEIWRIFERTVGDTCEDSSGYYNWKETDGETTKKYLYSHCLEEGTKDGKNLFLAATAYLDKAVAEYYLNQYNVDESYSQTRASIRQKALDVAKQIEIYLRAQPGIAIADLQNDDYFKNIAVQRAGSAGYTSVHDHNTMVCYFHADSDLRNMDMGAAKESLPRLWEIFSRNQGGHEAEGFYQWKEPDGSYRLKYMYAAPVKAELADAALSVAVATYVDEYENQFNRSGEKNSQRSGIIDLQKQPEKRIKIFSSLLLGALMIVAATLLIVYFSPRKKTIHKRTFIYLSISSLALVVFIFLASLFLVSRDLKRQTYDLFVEQQALILNLNANEIGLLMESLGDELDYLAHKTAGLPFSCNEAAGLLADGYYKSRGHVYAAYRIGPDGRIVNMHPVNPNSFGADISAQEHVKKIKQTEQPVISGVFEAIEGFTGIAMHHPVFKDNEYDGSVAFLFNPDSLLKSILPLDHEDGTKIYLLDQHDRIIYSNSKEAGSFLYEIAANPAAAEDLRRILSAEPGVQTWRSGDTEYAAVHNEVVLNGGRWKLLAVTGQDGIFSRFYGHFNYLWLLMSGVVAVLIVLGLAFYNFFNFSFRKEIENKAKEFKVCQRTIETRLEKEKKAGKKISDLLTAQKKAKAELEYKIEELKKFRKLAVDREIRMIDLKEQIKKLKNSPGQND